jgi:predicted PurR-regulated permease PerM
LFLGFIITVALNPAVTFLQRRLRLPRAIAGLIMYLLVIGGMIAVVALILPPLTGQLYQLLRSINIPVLQTELNRLNFTATEISSLVERVSDSVGVVFSLITSTFTGIFTFFTLLVVSFYLMLDRPNLHKKMFWFTRDEKQIKTFEEFLNSLEAQLGGWVRGQFVLMLVIGIITYIGLTLIGVPYALPLAILAGLLEIVPNLGPTLASLPAIMLAYGYLGPVMSGVTVLFYILVQQIENNVIVPKIMKDSVDVNPLVAIITILIGLKMAGVVGALLSVPTYIVIRTLYSLWYRKQVLSATTESAP